MDEFNDEFNNDLSSYREEGSDRCYCAVCGESLTFREIGLAGEVGSYLCTRCIYEEGENTHD